MFKHIDIFGGPVHLKLEKKNQLLAPEGKMLLRNLFFFNAIKTVNKTTIKTFFGGE